MVHGSEALLPAAVPAEAVLGVYGPSVKSWPEPGGCWWASPGLRPRSSPEDGRLPSTACSRPPVRMLGAQAAGPAWDGALLARRLAPGR